MENEKKILELFEKYEKEPIVSDEMEMTVDDVKPILKRTILLYPGAAIFLLGPVGVGKTTVTLRVTEEIAKEMQGAGIIKYIIKLDRFPEGSLQNWRELLEKNGYLPGYTVNILPELKEFIRDHVNEVFLIAQIDIAAAERVDYVYPKITPEGVLEHELLGQLELLSVKKVTETGEVLEPRGVIITDEITNADQEMLKFVLRLIRDRRISSVYLSRRLVFIAMGNRAIDNALAEELDAASLTRANVIHIRHTPWKTYRIVLENEFEKFLQERKKELPETVFRALETAARERFARAIAVLSHESLREAAYTTDEPAVSGDRPFPTERSLTDAVIEYAWVNNLQAFVGRLGEKGRVIIEMLRINPPSVHEVAKDPKKFLNASEDQKLMFAALLGVAFRTAVNDKDPQGLRDVIIGINLISDPDNWSRSDLALEAVTVMLAAIPSEDTRNLRVALWSFVGQRNSATLVAQGIPMRDLKELTKMITDNASRAVQEAANLLAVNITSGLPEDLDDIEDLEDLDEL